MSNEEQMEIVEKIEDRLDDWRQNTENGPTIEQLLAALAALA